MVMKPLCHPIKLFPPLSPCWYYQVSELHGTSHETSSKIGHGTTCMLHHLCGYLNIDPSIKTKRGLYIVLRVNNHRSAHHGTNSHAFNFIRISQQLARGHQCGNPRYTGSEHACVHVHPTMARLFYGGRDKAGGRRRASLQAPPPTNG